MQFNVSKCKVMHVGKKNPRQQRTEISRNGERLTGYDYT